MSEKSPLNYFEINRRVIPIALFLQISAYCPPLSPGQYSEKIPVSGNQEFTLPAECVDSTSDRLFTDCLEQNINKIKYGDISGVEALRRVSLDLPEGFVETGDKVDLVVNHTDPGLTIFSIEALNQVQTQVLTAIDPRDGRTTVWLQPPPEDQE